MHAFEFFCVPPYADHRINFHKKFQVASTCMVHTEMGGSRLFIGLTSFIVTVWILSYVYPDNNMKGIKLLSQILLSKSISYPFLRIACN